MHGLSTAGVALNALRAFLLAITIFGWPWVVFQNDFCEMPVNTPKLEHCFISYPFLFREIAGLLGHPVVPLFSCFMVSSQINHISESTMSYRSPHWYR